MATSETVGEEIVYEAEHGGGMPQLDFDTWPSQIFWVAVALFVLYRVLVGTVLPRIASTLEDRHNAIADDLDRASSLKQKAEEAQANYEKALAEARSRANEIAEGNRAEIGREVEAENARAEAEIAARTAEGEQRIAEIKAEAAASARSIATDAAEAIVAQLSSGGVDRARIESAVDQALSSGGAR